MHFSYVTQSVRSDAPNVGLSFFPVVCWFVTCTRAFPVWQTLMRAVSFEKVIMNRRVNPIYLFIYLLSSTSLCSVVVWVYIMQNIHVHWGFPGSFRGKSVMSFTCVEVCFDLCLFFSPQKRAGKSCIKCFYPPSPLSALTITLQGGCLSLLSSV